MTARKAFLRLGGKSLPSFPFSFSLFFFFFQQVIAECIARSSGVRVTLVTVEVIEALQGLPGKWLLYASEGHSYVLTSSSLHVEG